MVILYSILVLSILALLWVAGACALRIRRQLRRSEAALRRALAEIEREHAARV